jgi:deoxyribose-phosphate aldolase
MKIQNYIDHTILKPEATKEQVIQLCLEAKEQGFASVCVNPSYASLVSKELAGSAVKTCVVIGFPLGATTAEVKAFETESAIKAGAQEVDMVINIGALKDGDDKTVLADIQAVVKAAKNKALVKVIIEACLLTEEEKVRVSLLIAEAGARFVKTSTGFSTSGATAADVALIRDAVNGKALIKASGGIRDYETALAMIKAGAARIGTSSGVKIKEEANSKV